MWDWLSVSGWISPVATILDEAGLVARQLAEQLG
jgi:hypothetical protein